MEGGIFKKLLYTLFVLGGGLTALLFLDPRTVQIVIPNAALASSITSGLATVHETIKNIIDPLLGSAVSIRKTVGTKTKNTLDGLLGSAEEKVGAAIDGTKNGIVESIREKLIKQINNIATGLGGEVPASNLAISDDVLGDIEEGIQKSVGGGAPVVDIARGLTVKKSGESARGKPIYIVNVLQEKIAIKDAVDNIAKTLAHIWDNDGEYVIKMPITRDGITRRYAIYIIPED